MTVLSLRPPTRKQARPRPNKLGLVFGIANVRACACMCVRVRVCVYVCTTIEGSYDDHVFVLHSIAVCASLVNVSLRDDSQTLLSISVYQVGICFVDKGL